MSLTAMEAASILAFPSPSSNVILTAEELAPSVTVTTPSASVALEASPVPVTAEDKVAAVLSTLKVNGVVTVPATVVAGELPTSSVMS